MLPFFIAQSLFLCYRKWENEVIYSRENLFIVGNNYFKETVLPSVELPYKASYSIPESVKILGCSKVTLWRMNRRGQITIAPNKRVYCRDFEVYFNRSILIPSDMKA